MTTSLRRICLTALSIVLVSCGGDPSTPPVPDGTVIAVSAGNLQTVAVAAAAAAPLAVSLTDPNGAPLSGIPVTWSISFGGGSLAPASSMTDAGGIATTTYTAGTTSGAKTIHATVGGASGSPVSFSLTVTPGPAARMVKAQGDGQTSSIGTFPTPFSVSVVDAYGNGVAGVSVAWAVTAGSGNVAPASSVSDAAGLASAQFTGSGLGSVTLTATTPGLTGSPVTFSANVSAAITLVRSLPIPDNYALHDQFVRGGLAFLCAWNTGLLIYDVGDGRAGGSPADPKLVGSIITNTNGVAGGAQIHNAWWFWNPNGQKKYVFVGQEGPPTGGIGVGSSGDIHVVDVTNMAAPVEVGSYRLPGAGVHNFWMDEANQILYAAYYNGGVVALNVSGTLPTDLTSRVIANVKPGGTGNTYVWGVQLYNGSLYATDMLSGFWQLNAATLVAKAGGSNVGERYSSDQWVANGYAYSGTWGRRVAQGNALKIWQLNGTGAPVLVDSIITLGAGTVSDVEVSADNKMLMFSTEGGLSNGVHFYSLAADPAHPTSLGFYPVGTGVHTATFAEINGRRYAFAAKDPGSSALLILDVTGISPP